MSSNHIDDHSSITTNVPISFYFWSGKSVAVTLTQLTYQQEQAEITCIVTFTVETDIMKQLITEEWFNLLPHAITAQVRFDSEQSIEVRAMLSPAIAKQIASMHGDAETLLAALLPEEVSGTTIATLAKSDYWYVLDAKQTLRVPTGIQQSGSLSHGFKTIWTEVLQDKKKPPTAEADGKELNLTEQVESFLQTENLKYEYFSDRIIRLQFNSQAELSWISLIRIEPEDSIIVLYSVFPEPIPTPLRQDIALQLMGENYELLNGAFEMDQEDGELRFRSSLLCADGWNESSFTMLLNDQLAVMEHYLPIVSQVIQSN